MDVPKITEVASSRCGLHIYAHSILEHDAHQLHFIAASPSGSPIFVGTKFQCDIWLKGCEFAIEKLNESNRRLRSAG